MSCDLIQIENEKHFCIQMEVNAECAHLLVTPLTKLRKSPGLELLSLSRRDRPGTSSSRA